MAYLKQIYTILLAALVAEVSGQFSVRPESQVVALESSVRLDCTASDNETSLEWWRGGVVLRPVPDEVEVMSDHLLLPSVQWNQIGEYLCNITADNIFYLASATVNITGYRIPYVEGEPGVSVLTHQVGQEQIIMCPISGYSGPFTYYWQTENGEFVTTDVGVESGVFVNEDGGLDLSRIQMEGNELFSCTGVDEVGNSARTRFRITSSLQEEDEKETLDLTMWYFILAYCVGSVLIISAVVVALIVCWISRDQCCDRIAQRKATRTRVRRSKIKLDDMV